jgi:multiple sugar transport system substrate-binding protein
VNRQMNRRTLLRLAGGTGVAVAGAAALAACGSSNGSGGGGGGKTTLRFSFYGSDDRIQRFQKVAALYESKNPDVKVAPEFGTIDSVKTKVSVQLAGGNPPDVFWGFTDLTQYIQDGRILDLGPYVGKGLDLSGMDKATLSDGVWDGKQYAVPHGLQSVGVFGDQTRLAKLGLSLPEYPDVFSWADYAELNRKVKAASPAKFWGTDDPTYTGALNFFRAFARQHGEDFWDGAGHIGFTAGTLTEWFSYWDEMRHSGAAVPAQTELEQTPYFEGAPMIRGLSVFHMRNTNQMLELQGLTKDTLGLHPVPGLTKSTLNTLAIDPNLVAIAAASKNKDAAVKFLDFLLNDEDRAKIVGTTIGAPPNARISKLIEPTVSAAERKFLTHIRFEASQERKPTPKAPAKANDFNTAVNTAAEDLAYGKSSVADAVTSVMQSAEKILA